MTLFLRLLDIEVDDKASALRHAAQQAENEQDFDVDPKEFAKVPGSPFAYWVSEVVRQRFAQFKPFQSDGRIVASGGKTLDDFRFIRAGWELDGGNAQNWPGFAKGGAFSQFYSDVFLRLCWVDEARCLKAYLVEYRESRGWSPNWTAELHSNEYYFRPGLTWPRRTQSGLGMRAMPEGCIFADKGPAAFVENNASPDLLALLAITISSTFRSLVELQMAFGSYEVGVIQRTPVPNLTDSDHAALAQLARRAWSLKRTLDTVNETSHAFLLPSLLRSWLGPFEPLAIEKELAEIQAAIDDLAFRAYGLEGEDRAAIEAWASKAPGAEGEATEEADDDSVEAEDDPADGLAALQSWAVGVAFGRFDLRLATGERRPPAEPEPFDPLPARSPGMIPEADAAKLPPRAILVDEPGHALDLTAHVTAALDKAGFAPESPDTLRRWLARDFFPLHIKMYSKSRRKAPIYWQLATSSASYSIWLHIHAFTPETLPEVQATGMIKVINADFKLTAMRADFGPNPKPEERKILAAQEILVEELTLFIQDVVRVAPLWNPNLDDGVLINFAPLWRLVPHHKPWQKELKATWDALCAGDYDWAHLAMHLWPERVVPQCATDRSLAIAHSLEDVFWSEGPDGKWKPRATPERPVDELVKERTSAAVKAALKSLLEAPAITGGGGRRGRKGKGNAA